MLKNTVQYKTDSGHIYNLGERHECNDSQCLARNPMSKICDEKFPLEECLEYEPHPRRKKMCNGGLLSVFLEGSSKVWYYHCRECGADFTAYTDQPHEWGKDVE
jgi:hypothetical protein